MSVLKDSDAKEDPMDDITSCPLNGTLVPFEPNFPSPEPWAAFNGNTSILMRIKSYHFS